LTDHTVFAHSEVTVFEWSLATCEELANHFHHVFSNWYSAG